MAFTSFSKLTIERNDTLDSLGFDSNLTRPIVGEGGVDLTLDDVDSNVTTLSGDVVNIVTDVNTNTDAKTADITTDVNANTDIQTSDIKERISNSPIKRYANSTSYYESYTTIFSYTGAGTIEYIKLSASNYHSTNNATRYVGIRLKVDGVTVYSDTKSTSTSGLTITAGGALQYDIGDNTNLLVVGAISFLLGMPFAQSIVIEAENRRTGGFISGLDQSSIYSLVIRET